MFDKTRIVAVIRESSHEAALFCAAAAYEGGIRCLEFAFGGAGNVAAQAKAARRFPDAHVGVGTVLSLADLRAAADAGATFAISPHTDEAIVKEAKRLGLAPIPGAMTPTEIVRAHDAGAAYVKVFPIGVLGGAEYLRHLRAALRHIKVIATGGVRLDNTKDLLVAGASAVGAATDLFRPEWVAERDTPSVRAQAERYVAAAEAR